jgi:uncharacterized coiled-coil DUF342 family protein
MKKLVLFMAFSFFIMISAPSCTGDRAEYDRLKALRDEYRAELTQLRQANDTINKNITSAYQELENLQARAEEKTP